MPRRVTLVLVDGAGDLVGKLASFDVTTPWWQDVEPIAAVHPDLVILRLLHVRPAKLGPMGGDVTYLAECDRRPRAVEQVEGPTRWLDHHPLRMPWACPGGPRSDLAWARRYVAFDGPPRQVRSWNLSSVWRIPTTTGEHWLKCVPPFLGHEATVLANLGPSPSLPSVVAADGHRMLLAAMPGEDGYGADNRAYGEILEALVGLQLCALRMPERLATILPDWSPTPFGRRAAELVRRRAPDARGLNRLIENWDHRFAAIADCGLPTTLFHGDPHPGNARIKIRPPVIFDWGDSGAGHPLLDLTVLEGLDEVARQAVAHHWLSMWADAFPGSHPARAWRLLRPAALLRCAIVFQGFLDHIEPSEHIYHRDDVTRFLTAADELMSAEAP